jgi:hypothetical protein
VPITALCFTQSATTGFTARVFSFHNRLSRKEAFEGLEPDDGKLSRPVLRRPAPSNGGWLLGGQKRVAAELSLKLGISVSPLTVRAYWPSGSDPTREKRTGCKVGGLSSGTTHSRLWPAIFWYRLRPAFECFMSWL